MITLKEKVFERFANALKDKIGMLQQTLDDLKETASNETKSTAGDKHETALAMVQIEQENTARQLKEALAQKLVLERINISVKASRVSNGSLVKTNKGYFFFSVALGKIKVDDITVIALSAQSPLGARLSGLKVNESASLNGSNYVIEHIE